MCAHSAIFSAIFGASVSTSISSVITVQDRLQREVDIFMQCPTMDIDEHPLDWWKLEANRLPLLSSVARKYLCACASSVPSERVFSVGGNIVNSKRNSLHPDRVKFLIFLARNLCDYIFFLFVLVTTKTTKNYTTIFNYTAMFNSYIVPHAEKKNTAQH